MTLLEPVGAILLIFGSVLILRACWRADVEIPQTIRTVKRRSEPEAVLHRRAA